MRAERKGRACSSCGGPTHVTDTRRTTGGMTRRRRECLACWRRSTTYEVEVAEGDVVALRGSAGTPGPLVMRLIEVGAVPGSRRGEVTPIYRLGLPYAPVRCTYCHGFARDECPVCLALTQPDISRDSHG